MTDSLPKVEAALAKMRALGLTDDEQVTAIEQGWKLTVSGVGEGHHDLIDVFCKIAASGRLTLDDVQQMCLRGVRIPIRNAARATKEARSMSDCTPGNKVQVTFTGIVTKTDGDQVQVTSPRFYGGGRFKREQIKDGE